MKTLPSFSYPDRPVESTLLWLDSVLTLSPLLYKEHLNINMISVSRTVFDAPSSSNHACLISSFLHIPFDISKLTKWSIAPYYFLCFILRSKGCQVRDVLQVQGELKCIQILDWASKGKRIGTRLRTVCRSGGDSSDCAKSISCKIVDCFNLSVPASVHCTDL